MPFLNSENYNKGFLIDEEWIGGVTEMDGNLYSAYVSHYLTGETIEYKEFEQLGEALAFLNAVPRNWKFESVGCSTTSSAKTCSNGKCQGCS